MKTALASLFVAVLAAGCGSTGVQDADAPASRDTYVLEGSGPERYEAVLVPVLFAPWADDLVRRAEIQAGERVLDLATGTGVVARRAAAAVGPTGSVAALDIAPAMLAVARGVEAPAEPRIEWTLGDALELPFADGGFDVVLCQQALQFFPDRARAAAEMRRVLAPGGRVLVSVWRAPEHNPYALAFARAVERRLGPAAGAETRSPFAWDDPAELASTLRDAGFVDVAVEPVELDMREPDLRRFVLNDLLAYPATGAALERWDDAEKEDLIQEILAALASYRDGGGWTMPWTALVGSGVAPRP